MNDLKYSFEKWQYKDILGSALKECKEEMIF